mgnify:FL=1
MTPYPEIKVCPDPDNCTELHNELPGNENHHYGCECFDCILYYRSLK